MAGSSKALLDIANAESLKGEVNARYPDTSLVGDEDVLYSIQHVHAERIYQGQKKFELRKVAPNVVPRRIFLYESNGTGKITGHFVVSRVLYGPPDALWKATGNAATTKERFFEYFAGREIAFVYEIESAVKYSEPVVIRDIESTFRAPQSFIYLAKYPELQRLLSSRAMYEALSIPTDGLFFLPISVTQRDRFIEVVKEHITDSYLETGEEYAKTLLRIHDIGQDTEGIFTKRKFVLEAFIRGHGVVGYTVLTEKIGGSIKTGPTIVHSVVQRKGFGKHIRAALHSSLMKAGYRKVYCTAPLDKFDVLHYLLSAGYRIEAHLTKHYHASHDELVFGYWLSERHECLPPNRYLNQPVTSISLLTKYDSDVVEYLEKEMPNFYMRVPKGWAERQVLEATNYTTTKKKKFKDRAIYVARGAAVVALALCIFKRGGSTKILLITSSDDEYFVSKFLSFIEKSLKEDRLASVRKIYLHLNFLEGRLCETALKFGFELEGVLQAPYEDGRHLAVLGKLLK